MSLEDSEFDISNSLTWAAKKTSPDLTAHLLNRYGDAIIITASVPNSAVWNVDTLVKQLLLENRPSEVKNTEVNQITEGLFLKAVSRSDEARPQIDNRRLTRPEIKTTQKIFQEAAPSATDFKLPRLLERRDQIHPRNAPIYGSAQSNMRCRHRIHVRTPAHVRGWSEETAAEHQDDNLEITTTLLNHYNTILPISDPLLEK